MRATDGNDPNQAAASKVKEDAQKLVEHIEKSGIEVRPSKVSYSHMGALISNAILQQRRKYATFVVPRVKKIEAAWPDATTTTRFLDRLDTGGLTEVAEVRGRFPNYIRNLTVFLQAKGIESPDQLREEFDAADPAGFLRDLRRVVGVGPKTRDYLGILSGSKRYAAVDARVQARVRDAGVSEPTSYAHVAAVIEAAAAIMKCEVADLDKAIWLWEKKSDTTA